MTVGILTERRPRRARPVETMRVRSSGLAWLVAAEGLSTLLGFAVVVHWARSLGPGSFGHVEYALAVSAWLLIVVRGGIEMIVYREAARRPRLVHALTEVLLGMRCACAVAGYLLVLLVAWLVGAERGLLVAVAGVALIPSALVVDVGLRATGRLGGIALAQSVRAVGYAVMGYGLVHSPVDAVRAAWCGVLGEVTAAIVLLIVYGREHPIPRPRFRCRAWAVLASRGAIATLTRFGRVTLYGADMLVLGWWAGAELGPYAAARRIVFALVGIGLVVPTAVAPAIARAWLAGSERARDTIGAVSAGLWALSLPASLGLALTAARWMPLVFGPSYRAGGIWLVLVAARLPWLLSNSLSQAALIACRRERQALHLVLGMTLLALFIVPAGAVLAGPSGVGTAALVVEMAGALGGWLLLRTLGAASAWHRHGVHALLGCLTMGIACWVVWAWPVWAVSLTGAVVYTAFCFAWGDTPARRGVCPR